MTPEQESQLLANVGKLTEQIQALQPLAAKVPELEKTLKTKDDEIIELRKGHSTLSQGAELSAFKTAYPDVPEVVFHNTPADKRKEVGDSLQKHYSQVKAPAKTDLSDPMSLWTNAGGIGPTDDATIAAEQEAKRKEVAAAKAAGDPLRMLKAKGSAVMGHLARSLRAPVIS